MTTLVAIRAVMVAAGLALVGIAVRVDRTREGPALRPFVVLVGVVGGFAVLDGIAVANPTALSIVWLVAYLAIPAAFTWFIVEYYGLPYLASPWRKVAFIVPVALGIGGGVARILSPAAQGAMVGGGMAGTPDYPTVLTGAGFAEQLGLYYASGVMLVGVALLVRTVARYDHLDGRLGAVLSLVPVWPWLAYFTTPGVAGALPLEAIVGMTAGGYALSAAAAVFAVTRGGLFAAAPAAGTLGPGTVLEELDDPVVVIDAQDRIVRLNASAAGTFEAAEAAGQPVAEVVGTDLATLSGSETVELDVAGGVRQFEVSVSPVTDRLGRSPGRAVVFRDVTAQRVRAQRLAVLNRVLRHNLRNEMTTIIGRAQIIASDTEEHDDTAEAIIDSADDLVDLGERAHEVEEMMAASPDGASEVSVAALAERVVERHRSGYPEASLSVDAEASLSVTVDGRILSQVLENLVENALEHNDAPTPVVTVSARATGGGVRISVADNGPGLPEQERTVIESETESPLEHGSGLGLWAVNWGVTRLGGDLAFAENEPEGTVVTVTLPTSVRADATAGASAGAEAEAD